MAANHVLYIGLSPALQRRVDLDGLAVGCVNRARGSSSGIGGKGQGGYVAALQLAHATIGSEEVAAGPAPRLGMFLGSGREGDALASFLQERRDCGDDGNSCLWVRTSAACRICTTLVDASSGDATEIVEPSGAITPSEWDAFLSGLDALVPPEGVEALAIMGTAPPGTPADGYEQIVKRACGSRTKVLVDSVVNLPGTLRAAAEQVCDGSGGVLLKLNAREVLKLTGREVVGSDSQVAADPDMVGSACMELAAQVNAIADSKARGIDYICFTDGPFPGGVVAVRSGRRWRLSRGRPLRRPVVSPIGAGDATSAGTLHAWCRRSSQVDDEDEAVVSAFRFGLAVGAASCLTGENCAFSMADVWEIHGSLAVDEVVVS